MIERHLSNLTYNRGVKCIIYDVTSYLQNAATVTHFLHDETDEVFFSAYS